MNDSTYAFLIQSNDFGPIRSGAFDFTLLFEDSFLAIAPASIFLIAACARTAYLHGNPVKVESGYSKQIKVAFLAAFAALELALLLLWAVTPGVSSKASLPAACLNFVAAITLTFLSPYEHTRSVAPSTLIGVYLLVTVPCDIVRVRTLFLLEQDVPTKSIGTLFATSIVLKFGVLLSEATNKRSFLLSRCRSLSPEATSRLYSKSVYWWINPLMRRGYSRILNIRDLYTIDESLSSSILRSEFQTRWINLRSSRHGLPKTLLLVLQWNLVTSGMLRILLIGLKFTQPFLIQRTIDCIGDRQNQPTVVGWGLVGAYVLTYTGLALITASYNYLINRLIVKIRGGLVSLLYQKTVDLSITGIEEGAVLTLMSTDVDRITDSKGISLSGGQKQRLALARAVFARKDLLILDDIFSGLEADNEEHIFRNLFSKDGLIRRQQTTVLLVTHAVTRLAYSDWMIALSKDGAVAEQGTYDSLRNCGGYVSSLAVRFREHAAAGATEAIAPSKVAAVATEVKDDNEMMDLFARRTGDWVTYRHYFAAAGWPSTCLAVFWNGLFVISIETPGLLVRYFTVPDTSVSFNKWFMIAMGITATVSLTTLSLLVWQTFHDMIPRASNGIHKSLPDTVLMAPLSFSTKTDSGITLHRFSGDLTLIDSEIPGPLIGLMLQTALFLTGAGLMAATTSYFLVMIPVVILVLVTIQEYYLRTSRQLRHLDLETKAPLYAHFEETISGLITIRAFDWTEAACTKNLDLLDQSQKPHYLLLCIQHWLGVVLDLVVAALVAILMIIIITLRHKIDPGLHNVVRADQNWTIMETLLGAVARVKDFVSNTKRERRPLERIEPENNWPSPGAMQISDFGASYSDHSELVPKDINLNIRPGEKIGICGRTGSGKSSLLASLLHLLEFREGSISIDELDVASIPRDELRQRLNVINQEPYWMSTETVRFNLDPWQSEGHSNTVIKELLVRCQIWDLIEEKGGIDAKMDSDFFSPCQNQLFCLARAILRSSKLVVLDEVSSNVDVHTDSIMQEIIREEFRACTIVCVAHRLNTIIDYDCIVVLHAGRVVEYDSPQNLLSKPDSRFQKLYEM